MSEARYYPDFFTVTSLEWTHARGRKASGIMMTTKQFMSGCRELRFICIPFLVFLSLVSCAPKVSTQVTKSYGPLNYAEEVHVYGVNETPPPSEELGKVRIADTGFSIDCGYEVVIDKAKMEARKIGGNAIKIIEHILPGAFGSSCHRITASILKVQNPAMATTSRKEKTLGDVDYALLHVYRYGGAGAAVGYDLYLGDSVICRVRNNSRQSIRINKDGLNTLWAKTESKVEVPINVQFGNEYYLRCGMTIGAFIGRPVMQLVDSSTGKAEFESIKSKTKE